MNKLSPIHSQSELMNIVDTVVSQGLHKDAEVWRHFLVEQEFSLFEKALLYTHLDLDDLAQSAFQFAREQGDSFFQHLVPFVDNKVIPLAISVDPFEYVQLRKIKDEALNRIAAEYIAPRLSVSDEDKVTLIKSILSLNKIEGQVVNGQATMLNNSVKVLWSELQISEPQTTEEKVSLALEYSQDVDLELVFKNDNAQWIIKPAIASAWEKVKANMQEGLEFLAANTVMNPTFRKVATVCVVVGVALYAQDSSAGESTIDTLDQFSGFVDGKLKSALDAKDASCDISQFSSKFIKQGTTDFEMINRIGDFQVNYDIRGFEAGSSANISATKPIITKVANTGCGGITLEDVQNMIKPISKGLIKIVNK